jgi:hypothetical protein
MGKWKIQQIRWKEKIECPLKIVKKAGRRKVASLNKACRWMIDEGEPGQNCKKWIQKL